MHDQRRPMVCGKTHIVTTIVLDKEAVSATSLVARGKRLVGNEMGPIMASVIEHAELHLQHCYGEYFPCVRGEWVRLHHRASSHAPEVCEGS